MPSRISKSSSLGKSCRSQLINQVVLERVLGFTLSNNCAFSLDRSSGHIAYIAGCVVVIRQLTGDRQCFIQSSSKKPLTAVEFSPDGKFIATGESGHQPMVRLWNVADGTQLAEFAGHHFRVVAVRFSPSARYLVSLGSQEDNTVYVWDRASGQRVASAKVTNKINGVAFSPTGHFFVTVGVRHVRYWYLEPRRNRHKETLPLNGRNAVLGDLLNNTFTDVCCTLRVPNAASTYKDRSSDYSSISMTATTTTEDGVAGTVLTLVVSKAGQLMQFSDQRYLEKWVELRTSKASCISTSGPWLVVGCARGTCLLFESETLQFLAQLPLPHTLGSDLQSDVPCKQPSAPPPQTTAPSSDDTETPSHPDLLAIKLDWSRSRVICCYTDHSFYVWDISDLNNIRRRLSHFYHSRGVWSIDCFVETPPNLSPSMSSARFGDSHSATDSAVPSWWTSGTFVTCADDGTIRFWSLGNESTNDGVSISATSLHDLSDCGVTLDTAPASEQLLRIIYTDPGHKFLCITDRPSIELTYAKFEAGVGPLGGPPSTTVSSSGIGDSALPSPSSPTVPNFGDFFSGTNAASISSLSHGCCVRTVCISPDCRHLAVGDRDGHLRVYALETLTAVCHIPAHDSEILSLSFFRSDSVPELALLCSASRDRLIHIFDPNQNYSLVQTVADHSAAIFAARIVETEEDGEIRLISCGMDKSLLIRVLEPDEAGLTAHFALEHHLVGRHSQLDAAFTPNVCPPPTGGDSKPATARRRYLAVACQDRRLRIYNVTTGRPVRCYRGSFNEDGCLVRCTIDPTGSIVATSGSDKQLNLFHLLTGESIATLCGHSELALGLRFLPDLRRLVSVSSDSCIFVWRLSPVVTQHLSTRTTGLSKHTQSVGGYPAHSGEPVDNLHPVAPLRWPHCGRGPEDSQAEEEDENMTEASSWTNESSSVLSTAANTRQARTRQQVHNGRGLIMPDEDSEADLFSLDAEDLLPQVSLQESGFGDVHDGSDLDLPMSTDSFSSYQTATSTRVSDLSRGPGKPTFYFSVSALPAWARRKLSRRSSVALAPSSIPKLTATHSKIGSDCESIDPPAQPSKRPTSTNRRLTKALTEPRVMVNDQCSSDSLTSSQTGSGHNSPRADRAGPLMSQSDYGVRMDLSTATTLPRMTDSRRTGSAAGSVAAPRASVISAPSTPFRRDRSLTEFHSGHRALRQPKRHTVAITAGLQQQRGSPYASQYGSLRTRGHRVVQESISEIRSPQKIADDGQESSLLNEYNQPRIRHTIPLVGKSAPRTEGECLFVPTGPPSKPIPGSVSQTKQSDTTISAETSVRSCSPGPTTRSSYYRPASVAPVTSTLRSSPASNANSLLKSSSNRSASVTRDNKMASSKNQSSDSSSVSSDPVSESATSSSIRSAYGRTKMKTTEQRRDASKTHIGATTFASRQRALTTDPLSSARSAISRTNNTGSQLKKALSSISVEQTGLNSNTAETYTQSSGFQRDRDSQRAFPDDSSSDVAHTGSLPLGRTMSHVILTSPTVTHRSPSTRARWLPESSSSPKYSDSVVNMTDTLGSAANTSFVGGKPLRHSPTTPAVIRPSELRLTPASQTGKIVPAPAQKQHCSLPTSGMADANGPEPTVDESSSSKKSDPEPTAIQHKQPRPTRLVIADSSSNSALEESDQFLATRSALEAVQEALALAVQRCSEFKNTELGRADHNLNALRTLVTNELEWRFAQLRAMLDLSPICVEPPVARVLLADLVERLIPELRARSTELDRMDCAAPGSETKPAITQDKSLDEWIADSTTEATALNCAAEADDEVVQDQDPAREDYACDDLLQQTAYTDRVSWTLDTRAVVSEET